MSENRSPYLPEQTPNHRVCAHCGLFTACKMVVLAGVPQDLCERCARLAESDEEERIYVDGG